MARTDPRSFRGWYRAEEIRRKPGDRLKPLQPPAPLLPWRDKEHKGLMRAGVCLRCFGFQDDPRHTRLGYLMPHVAQSLPFEYTIFGR